VATAHVRKRRSRGRIASLRAATIHMSEKVAAVGGVPEFTEVQQ